MTSLEGVGRLPRAEVLLAAPTRVHEIGVSALHRTQQLEPLEPVGRLHHARPTGEALLQSGPHLGRNGQHIDLHDAHEATLVRPARCRAGLPLPMRPICHIITIRR